MFSCVCPQWFNAYSTLKKSVNVCQSTCVWLSSLWINLKSVPSLSKSHTVKAWMIYIWAFIQCFLLCFIILFLNKFLWTSFCLLSQCFLTVCAHNLKLPSSSLLSWLRRTDSLVVGYVAVGGGRLSVSFSLPYGYTDCKEAFAMVACACEGTRPSRHGYTLR